MHVKDWNVWIVIVLVSVAGMVDARANANNITNALIDRLVLAQFPEHSVEDYMTASNVSVETVAEVLKAIVRAGDVKIADDAVLEKDRELGCKAAEMKIAGRNALSVMGDLRLPNCQDFLAEVYNRPDGVGRHSAGKAIIHIGGTNALAFADAILVTNLVSKYDQLYLCREIWLNAAGFYDGGTSNESSALFRTYIVSTPFREMKIKGVIFADSEERRRYEQYRLSVGREECLRLVIEKGLDADGYFANQLAGLLAERYVKESGGLSITNEGGYVTNVPRPSTVSATTEVGVPAVVGGSTDAPVTNGVVTPPCVTVETASTPRDSFRAWIVFCCTAAILALLAALGVRKYSQRC